MTGERLEPDDDAVATPRRLALVRRGAPARVLEAPEDVVTSAPHLLLREVILFQACTVVLAVLALAFDAPLEGVADPSHTPNPAKAAWYFLGLQELLHYFPPVVAGVLLPGLVVLALLVIPYVRVNWETTGFYEQPWKRRLAVVALVVLVSCVVLALKQAWPVLAGTALVFGVLVLPALPGCPERVRRRLGRIPLADWIMSWFVLEAVFLTLIGLLFRGPGWSWTWPWIEGIY